MAFYFACRSAGTVLLASEGAVWGHLVSMLVVLLSLLLQKYNGIILWEPLGTADELFSLSLLHGFVPCLS